MIAKREADKLKAIIQQAESLESEKRQAGAALTALLADANANGWDARIIRRVLKHRRQDAERTAEDDRLFEVYLAAVEDLPLFRAAGDELMEIEPEAEPEAASAVVRMQGKARRRPPKDAAEVPPAA